MELPLTAPPTLCECVILESGVKIREALARIETASQKGAVAETIKEIKKTQILLEQNYQEHVVEFRKKYCRNINENAKIRAINFGEPLKTNGYTLGDLKKIREPPKKKSKKDKIKLTGGVAK